MALKTHRGARRVTIVKAYEPERGGRYYRYRDEDDRQPIRRVTVVKRDEQGGVVSREAFSSGRRRRRGSRGLRPVERGIRELLEFQARVLDGYLGRHRRSSEKRRNGWLFDMPENVIRAVRKSRPRRLFRLSRDRD